MGATDLSFWFVMVIANNYFAHDKVRLGVSYVLLAGAILAVKQWN